jgi:hypothetical protein
MKTKLQAYELGGAGAVSRDRLRVSVPAAGYGPVAVTARRGAD